MKKIILITILIILLISGCSITGNVVKEYLNKGDVISYLDANKYIGQEKTVEGTIVTTFKYNQGNIIFLNFHDPYKGYFTAIIWSEDWNKFPFAPEIHYKGKKVRVTGEIIDYKGSPEIVVKDPSQIKIIK